MMTQPEILRWIETIPSTSSIAVDDGGLTLVEIDEDGYKTGANLEIGGVDEDGEEDPDAAEC